MKKFLLLCIVVLFGLPSQPIIPTYAAVPKLIAYQATVVENGQIVNTTTAVTFTLFDSPTGGNPLYIEVQSVDIVNSLLNATIGTVEEINLDELDFDRQYYLEVKIGDNDALPRTPLTTSPYAMRAENANFATRAQTAVMAETVAPNSIVLSNLTDEVKNLGGDLVGTLPNPTIRPEAIIENIPNGSIGMDKLAADVTTLPAGPATGDLTGTYPSPLIRNFAVTTDKIADFAINTSKLDAGAVQSNNLGNNSVNTDKIENLTILNEDISNTAAIAGTKIVPNFGNQNIITTGTLTVSNVITTGSNNFSASTPSPNAVVTVSNTGAGHALNLNAGTDGNALLSNGNIVVNGNISATNLNGSGSNITNLNGSNITSGTVAEARIDASLTRDNESPIGGDIAGNYATGLTINTNAVNSAKIADGAIVNADVNAAAAIEGTKINPNFGAQNVTTTGIFTGDGSGLTNINGANLAVGSVTTTQILDGTILNADVSATAAIAGSKINPDFGAQNVTTTGIFTGNGSGLTNLNGSNVTTGTVAEARIDAAITRDNESPIGGEISGSYVTGLTINANAVTTAKIADNNVTEAKLDIANNPADNFILAYDMGTGKMEWIENATTLSSAPLQGNGAVGNPITFSTTGVLANQIWVRNSDNSGWVPSLINNDNVENNNLTVSKLNTETAVNGAILTSNGLGIATWSTALNDGILAETDARIAADNNLQSQIDGNTTSIANITNDLVAETTARIAGDANLQTQIDDINTDLTAFDTRLTTAETNITDLQAADITLQNNLSTETTARITGDLNLQNQVDAINTDISAFDTRLTTAEGKITTLESGLATEITTRAAADVTLQSQITTNANNITALTTRVTTAEGDIDALQAKDILLDAKDADLQTQIDDINTDISAFDTRLTTAEGKITTLESGLATEITTRAAADVTLQSQITTNANNITALTTRVTTAEGKITTLESGLATEITDRTNADTNLQNQVDDINTTLANVVENGDNPAAGDISGSYTAGFQINTAAVTSLEIADGTVGNIDLANNIFASKIANGEIDNLEFEALDGVTSNIQGQFDAIDANVDAKILVETNNRIADVDAEETARIADVNAEETARIAGDLNLQTQINTINTTLVNVVENGDNPAAGDISGSYNAGFQIVANAVTSAEIADDAVGTSEIAANAVTTSEIADNAVTTTEILNGTVANEDLASGIDALKVGLGTVDNTEFDALNNITGNIQTQLDGKMTNALQDGRVFVGNVSNVATGVSLTGDLTVSNTGLVAITANAVGSTEINDLSIQNDDLASGINAEKIGAGLIDNTEFSYLDNATSNIQNQIDNIENQLNLGTMAYQDADAVAITGGTIADATISGGSITNSAINGTPVGALTPSTGAFTDLTATNFDATDIITTTLNSDEITTKKITVDATTGNAGVTITSVDQTALVINVTTTEKAIATNGLIESTLGLLAGAINIDGTTNSISGVSNLTTTNLTVSNIIDIKNDNDTFTGVIKNSTSNTANGRVIINDGINQNVNQANNFAGKINADNGLEVGGKTVLNGSLQLSYLSTSVANDVESSFATYSVISYTGTATSVSLTGFADGINGQVVYLVNNKATGSLAISNGGISLPNGTVGVFIYANGWKQVKNAQ